MAKPRKTQSAPLRRKLNFTSRKKGGSDGMTTRSTLSNPSPASPGATTTATSEVVSSPASSDRSKRYAAIVSPFFTPPTKRRREEIEENDLTGAFHGEVGDEGPRAEKPVVTPSRERKNFTLKESGIQRRTPKDETPEQSYTLTHLYKNLEYHTRGQIRLSDVTQKVYSFVRLHYNIPPDFETKRIFGPWSGSSFEERVIAAYSLGHLVPKIGNIESEQTADHGQLSICTFCAECGHHRDDCPSLI